jgi:hypothetical protein
MLSSHVAGSLFETDELIRLDINKGKRNTRHQRAAEVILAHAEETADNRADMVPLSAEPVRSKR